MVALMVEIGQRQAERLCGDDGKIILGKFANRTINI